MQLLLSSIKHFSFFSASFSLSDNYFQYFETIVLVLLWISIMDETVLENNNHCHCVITMVEINYWTNGKIGAKVAFPRYTESVKKFRSQSRETASKRKPYRGLGTR